MFKELEKLDVKEVPRWVGTYVRTTLKELLDGSAYRGRRGRRGSRGESGETIEGPKGDKGDTIVGPPGETIVGPQGARGDDGDTIEGPPGERGVRGYKGVVGRAGDTIVGPKGDKGDTGPVPRHKWEGTRLSFEQPGGDFGRSVNLQGVGGGRGASGQGSSNSANPGYSSITLVGTNLIFARDKAGPLGPDVTVDLSGLAGGGGQVNSVVGGTNIDVDAGDPVNPIVNLPSAITAVDVNGVTLTAAGLATLFLNAEGNYVVPPFSPQSVVTGLTTAGDGDTITLTQTSGGNQIADTSAFLWKPGKSGGQLAYGSTLVDEHLDLTANPVAGVNLGRIRMGSAVEFLSISASLAPYAFNYNATESYSTPFVGGGLNMSGDITFSASTMIYESFRGAPILRTAVNPGFAAYTVLQALPQLRAGAGATHDPLNAVVLNAGPRTINGFVGTRTSASVAAVGFASTVQTEVSGAVMNVTQMTGITCAPKYSTVAGSSISFGTVRGMLCQNPAPALFAPSAGVESMTAYYGVDVQAIGFGGNVSKAALRSAINDATNARFLSNIGSAQSDFGTGDIHLNDSTYVKFGNTLANPDIIVGWDAGQAALVYSTFFGANNNPLYLRNSGDTWTFQQNNGGTQDIGLGFNVNAVAFGVVVPTPNAQNWFVRFEGPNNRQAQSAGAYSDVWWTAGGTIDVNGLALTEVNSFRIDANVTALNGGSVVDQSGLFIAGMGFPGSGTATRIQSLRVTGRARIDGRINLGSDTRPQITADQDDYQLAVSNSQRTVTLLDSDDDWNITGIDSALDYGQTGDTLKLYNVGSFNITLTDQDASSLAANRIITSTGVAYILGPDEMVELWYDDTGTSRWRMFAGTGA